MESRGMEFSATPWLLIRVIENQSIVCQDLP